MPGENFLALGDYITNDELDAISRMDLPSGDIPALVDRIVDVRLEESPLPDRDEVIDRIAKQLVYAEAKTNDTPRREREDACGENLRIPDRRANKLARLTRRRRLSLGIMACSMAAWGEGVNLILSAPHGSSAHVISFLILMGGIGGSVSSGIASALLSDDIYGERLS